MPRKSVAPQRLQTREREIELTSRTAGSRARYERACRSLAGGVSSGMRSSSRPYPMYYREGRGSCLVDVDGNRYIDYTLAWGPNILGHSPEPICQALLKQLSRGLTYGAQHDLEYEYAEGLVGVIPCADRVCFANSGTEIVQLALRLARAATGRRKHVKFEGHYHGWSDTVLVSYHPSRADIERDGRGPISVGAGQLPSDHVLVAQWNDRASVEQLFRTYGPEIASLICEPLLANSGCIPPEEGFLQFLRDITAEFSTLLIFDEVITGFRLHLKGAQGFYRVIPDLATYAKAAGGGVPLSVLAGNDRYMAHISSGKVVHAGTLNGNPLVLAGANATLQVLTADNGAAFDRLNALGTRLRRGMESILRSRGFEVFTCGEGSVFHLGFMDRAPRNYRETLREDRQLYSDLAVCLLSEGILVLPDGRWYISLAHTEEDVDRTLEALGRVTQ